MISAAPRPPAQASAVFGDRLGLAIEYADLLAGEASVRGLIGPAEAPRLWARHLLNCAVLSELVPDGTDVADIGAGAGLPGIPLAIARPDLTVVLVEPLLRRATWLEQVVARLELASVRVIRARAEELRGSLRAPVVTARAVAPLDRLARWCLPLVAPGGELLAMKGSGAEAELADADPTLRRLGAVSAEVVSIGLGRVPDPTSVIRVRVGTGDGPDRHQGKRSAVPGRPTDAGTAVRSGRRSKQQARQRSGGGSQNKGGGR